MALHRGKTVDIPTDAIRLSKEEAVDYQMKIMNEWPEWKDTIFFKYGASILGGAAAAVGIYCNNHYRWKLKNRNYGNVSSYLASAVIPAGLCIVFHYGFVTPSVVLHDTCGVCTEIRAASIQAMAGCVAPALMAPLAGFATALNYGTYNVPYMSEPMKIVNLYRKLTKPIGNVLFGIFLAQALLASGITIMESQNIDTVNSKLEQQYKKLQHS